MIDVAAATADLAIYLRIFLTGSSLARRWSIVAIVPALKRRATVHRRSATKHLH